MSKQNINIVGLPTLYNIFKEIKDNLSFNIVNFNNVTDFANFLDKNKSDNKNFFVITVIGNKDFILKKIKFENKNIFFLYHKTSKVDFDTNYNIFSYL